MSAEERPDPEPSISDPERVRAPRFDRFTARARQVLTYAQEEATRFNHNYIGTEHLLLGLVREGDGVGAKALASLGVELDRVRSSVEFIIGRGDRPQVGEVGLTPRAKKVIEQALAEARRLGHRYVGTEHLLLGILLEGEGIAAGVLQSLGISLDQARTVVLQILAGGSPGPKNNVVMCRLDDPTLAAVDSLIEAGIRTTRSDAVSWLVQIGIEANQPLLERISGTVAEIRRLREEARRLAQHPFEGQPPPASQPPAPAAEDDRPEGTPPSDPGA
jgi:ATP-dependent Clp protease ATP-binding subunit ClpA